MVALFARRVAVYPGDGLGEDGGRDDGPAQPVQPGARGSWSTCAPSFGEAVAEAAGGRWREPVAALLDGKGTPRAPGWRRGSGMEDSNAAPRRRASHERAADRDRRRRRRNRRGHDRQAPEPGHEGDAVHRVPGHRLLAVRDPVRARPRDRRSSRTCSCPPSSATSRTASTCGWRRRSPTSTSTAARSPRATRTRASTSSSICTGFDVGEARRPGRQPRRPALRQGHPRGDGVRQAARRHEARRASIGATPLGVEMAGNLGHRGLAGRLRRRGPVGAVGGARPRRRRAGARVARRSAA